MHVERACREQLCEIFATLWVRPPSPTVIMVARGGHGMIVLHHLASSGGTVFCKAMAAQKGCVLLNEIHPHFSVIADAAFSPTTPLQQYLARYRKDLPDNSVLKAREDLFRFQLKYLCEEIAE